jgi:RNA polymerase sigma-70 factor, ECF subfamily
MTHTSATPGGGHVAPAVEALRSASDQDVVAAVLAGERDAYALLIERHQGRVFHALLRMTGSSTDAEELTQDVFCRTYFALASYKPEYRFTTWLHQIASNLAVNFIHHRRRESPPTQDTPDDCDREQFLDAMPDDDPDVQPEAAILSSDQSDALSRAVAQLPEGFREILVMRHVLELSYEEIGAATGLPMGTVKSRLLRARRRVVDALRTSSA